MSKPKDLINDVRSKLFDRKKEELNEQEQQELESSMDQTAIDVIQDPSVKGRKFLMVKLKYNLDTRNAIITDVISLQEKAVGVSFQMNKNDLEYIFNKNNRGAKK